MATARLAQLFKVTWTAANNNTPFDIFCAKGSNTMAVEFCQRYGLVKSGSFSISVYTEAHANILAQIWCDRRQFLFDVWNERGSHFNFQFSEADLAQYSVPPAAQEITMRGNSHAKSRMDTILGLKPVQQRLGESARGSHGI